MQNKKSTRPEAFFLVAVLDVGTIFEVKFQRVRAQIKAFWLLESNFKAQITLEN